MLEAVFTANVDGIKVSGLTQWDRGQMLQIVCPDLPDAFQVHFTNRAREKAIPVQAVGADNTATVAIPDEIVREPFEVLAHLYFTEGDAGLIGETVKTVRMPITPRAQPEDYVVNLTQEQQTEAEILIDKMLGDSATKAANAAAQGALSSIQDALDNLPEGDTLVINDLTTGGASAALSAEMGKTLNSNKYSLDRGTAVVANDDLDTYTTPGSYICMTSGVAKTVINSPVTTTGWSLQVEIVSGASNNYLHQTLRVNNDAADVWKRRYHPTSGWDAWSRYATMDDLAQKPTLYSLPLSGDATVQSGRQAYYWKTADGIVTVSAEVHWGVGVVDSDSFEVGILPEGYRPQKDSSFPATWWFAKESYGSPVRVPGAVQIAKATGAILGRIVPGNIISENQCNLFVYASFVAAT